ncbi:S5 DRBM domain-containing protein [Citrus sinensis]|uniref:S5 DRBM domain-containing protein n=1 Tax=Citrus sinensis TaxID=2711 RepID=A0ACB8K7S6_CITSI|nr:S5 DRBM domain-containing protein [Citrus sinensis]
MDGNGLDLIQDPRDPNPIGSDLGQFKMNLDRIWILMCGSKADLEQWASVVHSDAASVVVAAATVEGHVTVAAQDAERKKRSGSQSRNSAVWTRFKAFVVVGDTDGHVGLGVKCSKEVATAIRGAIILAKLSVIPVRRGYWGNKIGRPHTVLCKVTGKCGSATVRMVPDPRGAGIVAARVPKKVLQFAGIDDVFTSSRGSTKTLGNFVKATFECLLKTYGFLTPDFWRETRFVKSPYQEYTDLLTAKPISKAVITEYTDEEVERSYEEFYEDVHMEFLKFGKIVNFKVCRNGSSHLRGNVYVHYKSLESAVLTYPSVNGRYFAGKQAFVKNSCHFLDGDGLFICVFLDRSHVNLLMHHYRRSRSREADRVKSGSGKSHDDERQVHETTWSRRRSNYHSESRSDETNSDGSWSDRDRD